MEPFTCTESVVMAVQSPRSGLFLPVVKKRLLGLTLLQIEVLDKTSLHFQSGGSIHEV